MESVILTVFSLILLAFVCFGLPVWSALLVGLALFSGYALRKGYRPVAVARMCADGVRRAGSLFLIFVLIGMLTGSWRASGTISAVVSLGTSALAPETFLLTTFLLNCAVSVLTGTAFGTAATMGAVCMAAGSALGVDPVWLGGAILSGVFFGDRCSPVSSSAALVSRLTGSNVPDNIRRMMRTTGIPFLVSCAIYAAAGFVLAPEASQAVLPKAADASLVCLLPAAMIIVLSLLRFGTIATLSASTACACAVAWLACGVPALEVGATLLRGFRSADPALAALNGGGIASMASIAAIVLLSSAFTGIFRETRMLGGLRSQFARIAGRFSPYAAKTAVSVLASSVSCSQTVTILLTHELCDSEGDSGREEGSRSACDLEDTAVVIAPLIPWCISGAAPLAAAGATAASILTAAFLWLLPASRLFAEFRHRRPGTLRPAAGLAR